MVVYYQIRGLSDQAASWTTHDALVLRSPRILNPGQIHLTYLDNKRPEHQYVTATLKGPKGAVPSTAGKSPQNQAGSDIKQQRTLCPNHNAGHWDHPGVLHILWSFHFQQSRRALR